MNETPYWFAIKYPRGFKYSIGDATNETLTPSLYNMQDTNRGALAYTLQQLWTSPQPSYIIYNDESPLNTSYNFAKGHTKGILATDGAQGFWLQHSTPKFPLGPSDTNNYEGLTSNGFDYGQHFFCLTLNADEIERLAGILMLNRPAVQDYYIADYNTNFSALAQGEYSTSPICESIHLDAANYKWTVFAKTSQWDKELYADCIAPELATPLKVESWIRGSACGPECNDTYSVEDIKTVSFNNVEWTEYDDHSKWAVGESHICFSDINRMTTQASRGGSAICVDNPAITEQFESAIKSTNVCN